MKRSGLHAFAFCLLPFVFCLLMPFAHRARPPRLHLRRRPRLLPPRGLRLSSSSATRSDRSRTGDERPERQARRESRALPRDATIAYDDGPGSRADPGRPRPRRARRIRAIYHSHPQHAAYFSAEDKKQATVWDEPKLSGRDADRRLGDRRRECATPRPSAGRTRRTISSKCRWTAEERRCPCTTQLAGSGR